MSDKYPPLMAKPLEINMRIRSGFNTIHSLDASYTGFNIMYNDDNMFAVNISPFWCVLQGHLYCAVFKRTVIVPFWFHKQGHRHAPYTTVIKWLSEVRSGVYCKVICTVFYSREQ